MIAAELVNEAVSLFVRQWQYQPEPSRWLLTFILSSHTLALLVVLSASRELGWLVLLLALLVGMSGWRALRLSGGLGRALPVRRVCWRETGGWELETVAGETLPVLLQPYSFYSLPLTVLNFRTRQALGSRRFVVVVMVDNCAFASRRHLLMRLKLMKPA